MSHQWQSMLELLREGDVTPLQCWCEIGVYRCADAVEKLRKRGYLIETTMRPFTTARGRKVKFAVYRLIAEPKVRKAA